jgi:hypothetical protein
MITINPPFSTMVGKHFTLTLFDHVGKKTQHWLAIECIDLYNLTLATARYVCVGKLVGKHEYEFYIDTADKNLPVYTISARWSEQMLCLLHTHLRGFYAFLRLTYTHEQYGTLVQQFPAILETLPEEIEFREFWDFLYI